LLNSNFSLISAENYDISRNFAENLNSQQNPTNLNVSYTFCSTGFFLS